MSEQFTPGPWQGDGIAICGGGQDICYMGELAQWSGEGAHPLPNDEANGRLIAAAPDLFAALEGLILWVDGDYAEDTPESRRIMAGKLALAKAKGEE